MKISIVYVSQTGNTELAAQYIQDGIRAKYPSIQVKMMNIRESELDMEFLEQSDAVVFGTPVYFSSMSWELKKWFDHSMEIKLDGKLGAAFVTANSPTGGTETAIMDVLRHMLVKGMFVCSGSGEEKRFHVGAVGMQRDMEGSADRLIAFGKNVAENALRVFENDSSNINNSEKE